MWIIFLPINQLTKEGSPKLILSSTIHSDKTPYEVVSFITDTEFDMIFSSELANTSMVSVLMPSNMPPE
jgi:hypothetical protein